MGPPSYKRSVVDRNVVMRRIPELKIKLKCGKMSTVIKEAISPKWQFFKLFVPFLLKYNINVSSNGRTCDQS